MTATLQRHERAFARAHNFVGVAKPLQMISLAASIFFFAAGFLVVVSDPGLLGAGPEPLLFPALLAMMGVTSVVTSAYFATLRGAASLLAKHGWKPK